MSMAILAGAVSLVVVGVRFFNNMAYQRSISEIQQQAQVALFEITKDVLNADVILDVSSVTHILQLRAFNTDLGYDTDLNPNLFDDLSSMGTITYRYAKENGVSMIRKTKEFDGDNQERCIFRSFLLEPNLTNYLFAPYGPGPPYNQVEITIRAQPPFRKDKILIYQNLVSKRSGT